MSQSDQHRNLIIQVVKAIECRYPSLSCVTDLQQNPGDPLPPLIDGFRPDMFATDHSHHSAVIAEAKTAGDLDNPHTYSQISAFIDYLEKFRNGIFILAVNGSTADHAKTIMRFALMEKPGCFTSMSVFDSFDFWLLNQGGTAWHLD